MWMLSSMSLDSTVYNRAVLECGWLHRLKYNFYGVFNFVLPLFHYICLKPLVTVQIACLLHQSHDSTFYLEFISNRVKEQHDKQGFWIRKTLTSRSNNWLGRLRYVYSLHILVNTGFYFTLTFDSYAHFISDTGTVPVNDMTCTSGA